MRQEKEITMFDQEQYDGDWPPENAEECLKWFSDKLAQVPEEFRNKATIEIDGVAGYEGSSYASIAIKYVRPETDEEMKSRESAESRKRQEIEGREKRQLEALKAKYEKP